MTRQIKLKRRRDWMVWFTWGWTRIFAVTAVLLLVGNFALLVKVNLIGSQISELERSTRIVVHDSADIQTKIYTITREVTFTELASISEIELREPKDLAIMYMQLPENTLVMR